MESVKEKTMNNECHNNVINVDNIINENTDYYFNGAFRSLNEQQENNSNKTIIYTINKILSTVDNYMRNIKYNFNVSVDDKTINININMNKDSINNADNIHKPAFDSLFYTNV